jgi:hypothetical protein
MNLRIIKGTKLDFRTLSEFNEIVLSRYLFSFVMGIVVQNSELSFKEQFKDIIKNRINSLSSSEKLLVTESILKELE